MDVSIIIVSFNTKEKTIRCLHSVIEQTSGIKYEIIVVDNDSEDGSVEALEEFSQLPNFVLIRLDKNIGFGRANNCGLAKAQGRYVFYLNSDTILLNNAVKLLTEYFDNHQDERIGALGGYLKDINQDGTHSYGTFPTYNALCKRALNNLFLNLGKSFLSALRLMRVYKKAGSKILSAVDLKEEAETPLDVDYITGADLFVKNTDVVRFDEDYFMYYEETDMEWKMKQNNLRRVIIPGPLIIHDQADTKSNVIYKVTDVFKDLSSVIYSRKHLNTKSYLLRCIIYLSLRIPGVRKVYYRARQIIYES